MAEIQGGAILAQALRNEGVDTIFNLPGDPMGPILGACRREEMRILTFRHEQAAAMAAQAWSYVSRRIGVCVVASGPAMTNAITGLDTAWANCWPMLLIGGNGELRRRGQGDFQETPQVAAAAPFCKLAAGVDDPRRIPYYVNTAVRTAMSGRPGPVYLDLPSDVITGLVDESQVSYLPPAPEPPRPAAEPRLIRQALEEIARAERPLLLIGKGVAWADAAEPARHLVERLQIPFIPSPMGKGVIADDHPLCMAGARSYALRNADLVILAGARFNWIFHFGQPPRFAPKLRVVQIDVEPSEIGNGVPATVGMVGDAGTVLQQLVDELGEGSRERLESPWLAALQAERQQNEAAVNELAASDAAPMNLYRMYREIREVLADDAIVAIDGENTMAVSRAMLPNFLPRRRLDAGVSGCMGVAMPYAIGAKVASPDTQVLALNGDFAFGWNGMEIETALRHRLPIVFLVANNGSIGGGRQQLMLGHAAGGDGRSVLRYDRMMEALGGHGEYVETPQQLKPALTRALASSEPSLLNVVIDPGARRKEQPFDWLARRGRMQY
ncbi:MAG TPA: thiamine pyrophosphate-binding protein [Dehalococcoidia bacterium]|nr:thiamine pyrophosphate-binding protein [Dehalococcoidia bacterium]